MSEFKRILTEDEIILDGAICVAAAKKDADRVDAWLATEDALGCSIYDIAVGLFRSGIDVYIINQQTNIE